MNSVSDNTSARFFLLLIEWFALTLIEGYSKVIRRWFYCVL